MCHPLEIKSIIIIFIFNCLLQIEQVSSETDDTDDTYTYTHTHTHTHTHKNR